MELKISPALEAKLDRIAAQQGRDTESLVQEALERLADYDEWFMREVERGLAQIQSGEITLLGISSGKRDVYFPDVPTFKEQGFDIVESIWRGVMVKAGTPRFVIEVLTTAIEKVKQTQEWKEFSRLNVQSSVDVSLDEMQRLVADEIESDRKCLESSGFLK